VSLLRDELRHAAFHLTESSQLLLSHTFFASCVFDTITYALVEVVIDLTEMILLCLALYFLCHLFTLLIISFLIN